MLHQIRHCSEKNMSDKYLADFFWKDFLILAAFQDKVSKSETANRNSVLLNDVHRVTSGTTV